MIWDSAVPIAPVAAWTTRRVYVDGGLVDDRLRHRDGGREVRLDELDPG